jgi:2,3-bisphosphoglycerate-independent phosphoglycerate mutase
MGNSEVGHMNLGAGRVVYQDLTLIDKQIETGEFFQNGALVRAAERAAASGQSLHLLGLVSDGGVHSSDRHIRALLELAKRRGVPSEQVQVHAILDGRDTPPRSAEGYLATLERDIAETGIGRIASVIGRYYAMDRDKRWERVERAYRLYVEGHGTPMASAQDALRHSYQADKGDEFVEAYAIGNAERGRIRAGDQLICFNYRADRMRQITQALGGTEFREFARSNQGLPELTTMTQYQEGTPFAVAFTKQSLNGIFPELISLAGLRQERIAETEKYAHVTFFFSGGREAELPGEGRILVPSPKVATYDLKPEMSAFEVKAKILASLERGETDVYVINFANADMVGHTGILSAAEAAVAAVDQCLREIVPAVVKRGGVAAITADHGNAEMLWDTENNQPHTAHTTNPVPIVLCGDGLQGVQLRPMGLLADVAPTLLELLGLERSPGMDGVSLFKR